MSQENQQADKRTEVSTCTSTSTAGMKWPFQRYQSSNYRERVQQHRWWFYFTRSKAIYSSAEGVGTTTAGGGLSWRWLMSSRVPSYVLHPRKKNTVRCSTRVRIYSLLPSGKRVMTSYRESSEANLIIQFQNVGILVTFHKSYTYR
jgi:hypothetical protein